MKSTKPICSVKAQPIQAERTVREALTKGSSQAAGGQDRRLPEPVRM
ncbi:MAG: hypothetical protein MRY63_07760 [Neomegalonema sp.]|nr:hypothetical protein [Neomegalonema sp.]